MIAFNNTVAAVFNGMLEMNYVKDNFSLKAMAFESVCEI